MASGASILAASGVTKRFFGNAVLKSVSIDILAGSRTLREQVEAHADPYDIAAGWPAECATFLAQRLTCLLY